MTFGFGAGVQRLGGVSVSTLAALELIEPAADVRPTGFVYADPTPALNGVYTWSGTAWARQRGLPDGVAAYTGVAGTANAITATPASGVDPAVCKVAVLIPAAANTGAATLNGEAIRDRSGNALSAGALAGGVSALLLRDGATWRLLTGNIGEISDVSGLQAALDGKVGAVHTHAQGDITGLAAALAAKADGAATTSALALKAPLASPAFTGNPTAPTPSPGDNDTSIATTGFVKAAIDVVLGGVSSAFDTLSEIAAAIALKADVAATTAALAGKQATNAILTSISGLTIAAGDLIVGTGANAFAKLAKGSAGQVLRVNDAGTALEYASPGGGVSIVKEQVFIASGTFTPNADANAYEIVVVGKGADGNTGNNGSGGNAGNGGSGAGAVRASGSKAEIGNAAITVTIGTQGPDINNAGTPTSFGNLATANSGREKNNTNTGNAPGGTGTSNLTEVASFTGGASAARTGGGENPMPLWGGDRYGYGGMGGNAGSSNNNTTGTESGGPAIVVVREYR
jgi:hypothetical protein